MSLRIAGRGWVTPLGSDISNVWQRLLAGEAAQPQIIDSAISDRTYPVYRVPAEAIANAPAHPRLRRSSAISRFAVVAGLGALAEAGMTMTPELAERTALIFAISNGGVIYTKRFYDDVVESGAQAASPLLFPETVFNAPASHLAAILGIAGATYTVVGDAAASILAVQMADDLMLNESLDYCLVVAAEEADWLLCDAYSKWRLLRARPPIEPFRRPPRGMILSEGAGALLLSRGTGTSIAKISAGTNFATQRDAPAAVDAVFRDLCTEKPVLVIASANGTFIDNAERIPAAKHCSAAAIFAPKAALGESVGASGMWQIICAAEALRSRCLPPTLNSGLSAAGAETANATDAIVSVCGLNQQVAGLRISVA
jgi:3-oxoacyl-(acyl-carrier-protein) synthase